MTSISAPRVLLPGGSWLEQGTVWLDGARIGAIAQNTPAAVNLDRGCLTPGLIDAHSNGAFGVDFASATPEEWHRVCAGLARRGVTSVLPTVITAPLAAMLKAVERIASARERLASLPVASILGAHMEGPFLAPARRGAHRAEWLAAPAAEMVRQVTNSAAAKRALRMMTLAPELPGAMAAIQALTGIGVVVSLGHSDASADCTKAAQQSGATAVTHIFNAMRPFSHRDPGIAGLALADASVWCCLIVDGCHVDPVACRLIFAAAGIRAVAVTDSVSLAGMEPGSTQQFGGAAATLGADGVARRADGTMAGAGIVLDEGVRRMIRAGIDPAAVLRAATEAPARMLDQPGIGHLSPGAVADMVWWDETWQPRRVWRGGVEIARDD